MPPRASTPAAATASPPSPSPTSGSPARHALTGDDAAMQEAIDASLARDPEDPADPRRPLRPGAARPGPSSRDELETLRPLHETMIEHVRRAPPHTSVYPGRILWMLLRTIDDDDLGGAGTRRVRRGRRRGWSCRGSRMPSPSARRSRSGVRGDAAAATALIGPAHDGPHRPSPQPRHRARDVAGRRRRGDPRRLGRTGPVAPRGRGVLRRRRLRQDRPAVPHHARRGGGAGAPAAGATRWCRRACGPAGVTGREVDVLKLVVAGPRNKDDRGGARPVAEDGGTPPEQPVHPAGGDGPAGPWPTWGARSSNWGSRPRFGEPPVGAR